MAMEHIIKLSCRLNMNNPQHRKVYDVLKNLDTKTIRSKSQFLIDGAEFYIDNLGKESFIAGAKDKSSYVTRNELKNELKDIERKTVEAAMTEARNEVIRVLGGAISGNNVNNLTAQENREDDFTEEEDMDNTVLDYASSFMDDFE